MRAIRASVRTGCWVHIPDYRQALCRLRPLRGRSPVCSTLMRLDGLHMPRLMHLAGLEVRPARDVLDGLLVQLGVLAPSCPDLPSAWSWSQPAPPSCWRERPSASPERFWVAGAAAVGAVPDGMDGVDVCAKAGPAIRAVASRPAANFLNIFVLLVVPRQRSRRASSLKDRAVVGIKIYAPCAERVLKSASRLRSPT